MKVELNSVDLYSYDANNDNHKILLGKFIGESKSKYIQDIDIRLISSNDKKSDIFDKGFIASNNNECFGYVFISKIIKDEIFLEISILKEYRGKGFGKILLEEVSEYIMSNYNIRAITLDIDPSNVSSVMTALSCGYLEDEDEYLKRNMNGKILYRMDNYNYINKRKKYIFHF